MGISPTFFRGELCSPDRLLLRANTVRPYGGDEADPRKGFTRTTDSPRFSAGGESMERVCRDQTLPPLPTKKGMVS